VIIENSPNVVILTGVMRDFDRCRTDKKLATKINILGTKNIIDAWNETNSKLVLHF